MANHELLLKAFAVAIFFRLASKRAEKELLSSSTIVSVWLWIFPEIYCLRIDLTDVSLSYAAFRIPSVSMVR